MRGVWEGGGGTKLIPLYYTLKQKVHRFLEIKTNLSLLNPMIVSNTNMVHGNSLTHLGLETHGKKAIFINFSPIFMLRN